MDTVGTTSRTAAFGQTVRLPANAAARGWRPKRLGAYQLLEPIGSGAMGRIYRARHVMLGRFVAIKILRTEFASDQACVARFIAEARAVNLLNHPHVIDVTHIARSPKGIPWFVMELLEGADLAGVLFAEAVGLARALEIMRQVCEALDAIHSVGIVHRDIKPENIFITKSEGRDFIKLIDFGVVRLRDPRSARRIHPEGIVGTPQYMSPEQVADGEIDHRADLYAVGVVLFELITGSAPFRRMELHALLGDVLRMEPPVPSTRVALPISVRADLDQLIGRCLAKNPAHRPQSAREIAATLDDIVARLGTAPMAEVSRSFMLPAAETDERLLSTLRIPVRRARTPSLGQPRLGWCAVAAALVSLMLLPGAQEADVGHAAKPAPQELTSAVPAVEPKPVAVPPSLPPRIGQHANGALQQPRAALEAGATIDAGAPIDDSDRDEERRARLRRAARRALVDPDEERRVPALPSVPRAHLSGAGTVHRTLRFTTF